MDRGVRIDRTYQLNFGGNTDFLNMLERERLESKKISKTNAVTSMLDYELARTTSTSARRDYVPWLKDRKWCHIRMEGTTFGDVPLNLELKLEVWDSPNSAGVIIDAIRCPKLGLDRGLAGTLVAPVGYFMKSPPIQIRGRHRARARRGVHPRRGQRGPRRLGREPACGDPHEPPDRAEGAGREGTGEGRGRPGEACADEGRRRPREGGDRAVVTAKGTRPAGRAAGAPGPGGSRASANGPDGSGPVDPGADRKANAAAPSAPRAVVDDRDAVTKLKERSVLRLYKAATWTLGRAPERASWEVGGILAQSTYLAWPARRRATRASLAHVLGRSPDDPRVDRLARRMYRNYAEYIVELMRLPTRPPGEISRTVDMSAADDAEAVMALGRGVIMVGAHVGFMEAGAAAIADRGWVVSAVADDTAYIELFEHLRQQRAAWGIRLLPWKNIREMYATLRRREAIGLLVDWGYRPDGVPVRLFGDWTTLPQGPATLAARTGAVILPITVAREADGGARYRGRMSPYIEVASTEPAEIARATQLVADAIEDAIRRHPDQWWVFKQMWPETDEERAALMARLPEYGLSADGPAPRP